MPMKLTDRFADQVTATIRQRGANYFATGRVKVVDAGDDFIAAKVTGSSKYSVELGIAEDRLSFFCTCPYAAREQVCKHVWATLLKADEENLLADVAAVPNPVLVSGKARQHSPPLPGQDDNFDMDDLLDEDWLTTAQQQAASRIPFDPALDELLNKQRQYASRPRVPPKPTWRDTLKNIDTEYLLNSRHHPASAPQIIYGIHVQESVIHGQLCMNILQRQLRKNGEYGVLTQPSYLTPGLLADPTDARLIALLLGLHSQRYGAPSIPEPLQVSSALCDLILPEILATGRCMLYRDGDYSLRPLALDPGTPWNFELAVDATDTGDYTITGQLIRDAESRDLSKPALLVPGGWVFWTDTVSRLNDSGSFPWIAALRTQRSILVPARDADTLPVILHSMHRMPPVKLPPAMQYTETTAAPTPTLSLRLDRNSPSLRFIATLRFNYNGHLVEMTDKRISIPIKAAKTILKRDFVAEQPAVALLDSLGIRALHPAADRTEWEVPRTRLAEIVLALIAQNWSVEAEGRLCRKPGHMSFNVSTGVDWFELHAEAHFDGAAVDLPTLLKALKRGDGMILLGDGTLGMLPEDWLRKYTPLTALSTEHDDHLRFAKNQAGLLDVLLNDIPEATCDTLFERVRTELKTFQTVSPIDPTPSFTGTLRPYQKEGLGWLTFLQRFGFGGCLADDMGLGKTIQVLALLDLRRTDPNRTGSGKRPSLVVVPRSLVFNWKQEAARFAPGLNVLDNAHTDRNWNRQALADRDIVLTTYGMVRRDIENLRLVDFDYVILDEAQAIKNSTAQTAKACRLLRCEHRLALSGTPVQNHLGELWSLFEFLNPGMLGTASVFKLSTATPQPPPPESTELLAKALRPFILRRTKRQVAPELPNRVEETIFCELETKQRTLYNELRDHYRTALLAKIDRIGVNRSKIMILEALLRLRQAACHPGLINPLHLKHSCAKLDALIPQLTEIAAEGHKTLVFSQFTSFLAIVQTALTKHKLHYEYLDGQTADRQACVERFQNNPDCPVFLISLKAGGLGLNLTAAEYVFLLDPWWNPAVEAQAIDRAHRIGQTRHVFAYRLIAADTVEEKVLELQKTKRELADSIVNADNSLIRSITREDLAMLLG